MVVDHTVVVRLLLPALLALTVAAALDRPALLALTEAAANHLDLRAHMEAAHLPLLAPALPAKLLLLSHTEAVVDPHPLLSEAAPRRPLHLLSLQPLSHSAVDLVVAAAHHTVADHPEVLVLVEHVEELLAAESLTGQELEPRVVADTKCTSNGLSFFS